MAMAYYQMSLQIAVLCSFDNLIHIAAAQNAIAVLLLHKHEQQQPSPRLSGDDDTANIMNGQLYILNHCHDIHSNFKHFYRPNVAKTMMSMAEIYTTKGNFNDAIVHYEYIVKHVTFFLEQ